MSIIAEISLFIIFFVDKTAYNIGRCHLLTEDWIMNAWKHRDEVDFNVNNEEFVSCLNLTITGLKFSFKGALRSSLSEKSKCFT